MAHLQTVKETVAGRPETTAEKAQRVAGEASQKAGEYGSAAAGHASDIAQDAQDAYNRQHGDSAYQKASPIQSLHCILISARASSILALQLRL